MAQAIFIVVVALIVLALGPLILRFLVPIVGICVLLLFIFGTGGLGLIPLIVLAICYVTVKMRDGGHI